MASFWTSDLHFQHGMEKIRDECIENTHVKGIKNVFCFIFAFPLYVLVSNMWETSIQIYPWRGELSVTVASMLCVAFKGGFWEQE